MKIEKLIEMTDKEYAAGFAAGVEAAARVVAMDEYVRFSHGSARSLSEIADSIRDLSTKCGAIDSVGRRSFRCELNVNHKGRHQFSGPGTLHP